MLKHKKLLLLIFSLIFVCLANFNNLEVANVIFANSSNAISVKNSVLTTDTTDELSKRYKVKEGAVLPEDPLAIGGKITSVSDNLLSEKLLSIYKHYDDRYTSNYLRMDMFKNFTMLDLSNIVQGTSNVIDLSGIKFLNFESLEELNLSHNNIENFDVTVFPGVKTTTNQDGSITINVGETSPVKNIKTLDISNNNLSGTLDVTYFTNLTNFNAGSNKFKSIKFLTTQESDCVLDYRNNNILNFSDLTLPTYATTKLILFGNPISTIDAIPNNVSVEIGLLNLSDNIDSSVYLKYIAFETLQIDIKIYTKSIDEVTEEAIYTEYNYNPQNLSNFMFKLGANNYKIDFVDKNSNEVLLSKEITVTPPNSSFTFVVKNKDQGSDYNKNKISQKAYIYFNVAMENGEPKKDENGNLVLINPDIKVYFRYGNVGEWIKGNICDVTKGKGTYNVSYKTVENGIESRVNQIPLQVSYNRIIPDFAIIVIIILAIIFLALVVVPLIKKLLDKMSKPN